MGGSWACDAPRPTGMAFADEDHKAEGTKVPQGCQGLLPTSPNLRFFAVGLSQIAGAFEQVSLFASSMNCMATKQANHDQITLLNDSNNYFK